MRLLRLGLPLAVVRSTFAAADLSLIHGLLARSYLAIDQPRRSTFVSQLRYDEVAVNVNKEGDVGPLALMLASYWSDLEPWADRLRLQRRVLDESVYI